VSADAARIERLIALAERLIEALQGDINALQSTDPRGLRTTDPEIQKIFALYGREASALNPAMTKAAPAALRKRFFETTGKIRETLTLHARLLTRVRNASEGMIRAISEEVERRRAPMRPYARAQTQAPRNAGALIYNSVV
jgi:hypothetical protein